MKNIILFVALILCGASVFGKDGIYLEFKITSNSMNGNSKTYTADGNTRSEMAMKSPTMSGPFIMTTLVLSNTPGKVYSLNERDKTYSEMESGKDSENNGDDDYDVTVIGKENVNNYNSTHVSIKNKRSQRTTEMWLSKDIAGYASYTSVKTKYLGGASFFNKLKEKGADGFVVRMLVNSDRGEKMQMDLVKAERKDIAASLFSLDGYSKSTNPGMPGGYTQPDMQHLKNMTPEERQKYMEKMQQQYKQQQH